MRRPSLIALALLILAGCAGRQATVPTVLPQPTALPLATPAPRPTEPTAQQTETPVSGAGFDEGRVREAIQATLDDYSRAYNDNDLELLTSSVDPGSVPLRRLVQERFTSYQGSVLGGGFPDLRVTELAQRDLGFVLAEIEGGGARYGWLFREVDGRWLLAEPTQRQLGERMELESEHFVYRTYAWSDEINPQIMALMEEAYTVVTERLGAEIDFKPTVDLRPIFGITPPQPATALAYYRAAGREREDRMVIFAPNSYAFGFYDPSKGWEGELRETLVHEFTHLVNQRSFMPVATMRDWMYEGLAEYVSDSPRAGAVSAAVRSGNIIPILDESGAVRPQDLDHLYLLERDRGLAYGLAYSLVAYIVEEHGGLDAFWELARTMNQTPGTGVARYDAAMREVLGVGYKEFDAGWRAWLEANY